MADIFISYAREDAAYVEALAARLSKEEWTVWSDRQIQAGRHYSTVIEREIDAARSVLVIWSTHSVVSDWVQNEATEGLKRDILIPVMIDDVRLPLEFRRVQTILLTSATLAAPNDADDRIIAAIESILGPSPKKRKARVPTERRPVRKVIASQRPKPSEEVIGNATAGDSGSPVQPAGPSVGTQEQAIRRLPKREPRKRTWWLASLSIATAAAIMIAVATFANRANETHKLPTKAEAYAIVQSLKTPHVGIPLDHWKILGPAGSQGWPTRVSEPESGIEFVLVEAGSFQMGSPTEEDGSSSDEFERSVELTKPFYLSVCETTQGQYERVMNVKVGQSDDPQHPVWPVNWVEARQFCLMIDCELPTEAQWEYAARAGTHTRFWWGDSPEDGKGNGNFADQAFKAGRSMSGPLFPFDDGFSVTSPVGYFHANRWGLQDMLGNVWEWCFDGYRANYAELSTLDPVEPPNDKKGILRGGSCTSQPVMSRCAYRHTALPTSQGQLFGFRAAKNLP